MCIHIYTGYVCVCVCLGICVYIRGLEMGSLIVDTEVSNHIRAGAYTQMEGDWLISSPLHLRSFLFFC